MGSKSLNHPRVSTFMRELYESFVRIRGVPIVFISLLLGLLYFYLSGNISTIALRVILPILVILIIITITLFDLSLRLYGKATKQLPSVKRAHKPPPNYSPAIAILLLEESEIYGHETLVSVYYQDEGFEVLIGIGFVLTRQNNGLIQVLVNHQIEESYNDIWTKVCQNDIAVLAKLLVKPSLPKIFNEGVKL